MPNQADGRWADHGCAEQSEGSPSGPQTLIRPAGGNWAGVGSSQGEELAKESCIIYLPIEKR